MDITQVLLAVPNLIIAVWVIYTLQKQNAVLQDTLSKIVDKLINLHPPQSTENADKLADEDIKTSH